MAQVCQLGPSEPTPDAIPHLVQGQVSHCRNPQRLAGYLMLRIRTPGPEVSPLEQRVGRLPGCS